MTKAPMIQWRATCQAYPCQTCGAGPGEKCTTYKGTPKLEVHAARSRMASRHLWQNPDEYCHHCHDNPPQGHTCPACRRNTP